MKVEKKRSNPILCKMNDTGEKMKSHKMTSLANHFLVAMPNMDDPLFQEGVIYMCEHNEEGAMGVLINKPSPIMLGQLFDLAKDRPSHLDSDQVIYFGGPVQSERGFLLHPPFGKWQSTLTLGNDIAITTSRDILTDIAKDKGPEDLLVTLGCSSWTKNQLEDEIANNYWLTIPYNKEIMFDCLPEERYQKALSLIGIRPESIFIFKAGHA